LHLALLNHYNHLFNGEKIINVSVNYDHIEFDDIIKNNRIFDGAKVNKVINAYSTGRESKYFIDAISKFKKDPQRITLYGNSKGGSGHPISIYNTMSHWVHSMYYFNLSENYLPTIENELKDKSFSGCLRINQPCPPWVKSDWHYSGTFYWMNNNKVFNKNINNFDDADMYSVEAFPGYSTKIEDSFSSFISEDYNFNSYNEGIWVHRLTKEYLGEKYYNDYMKHYENFVNPIKNLNR
jgi:hypothetical protein